MSEIGSIWRQLLGIVIGGISIFWANYTLAQSKITPDNTLGAEKSNVISNFNGLPVEVINNGAIRGQNLFHSFLEFNVSQGRGAYFYSPSAAIQNIVTRVTGNNRSEILGVLGTFGSSNPNLFLINPNGIIFGPNASLNVGGSFLATTANAIQFGNQGFFSASTPNIPSPLLTINPSALFFNQIPTGSIESKSGLLAVPNGRSLVLVGGDVSVDGGGQLGILSAPGGRVELGGLAEPGTVGLSVQGNEERLSYPEGVARSDVSVTNQGFIDVQAENGGSIAFNAGNVNLAGGSFLFAGIGSSLATVNSQAGDIDINATKAVTLTGGSSILNRLDSGTIGNAGNIKIKTQSLSLTNGSRLDTSAVGQGNAGNIMVQAQDNISLANSTIVSNVGSSKGQQALGNVGNIELSARAVSLNGAQLQAGFFSGGQGNAGIVSVKARDSVSFAGTNSGIFTNAESGVVGNGSDIQISAPSVSFTNGAVLEASNAGQGNAGNINITAGSLS